MLGVESIIPIAEKTFTGIHSINYNQTVFSESIFLITNSSLKIVYLYTPFDFKYKILFEDKDFLNKNKTAFDFSRLRNSFALSKGQYGRTKIVLNSIAMPIYKQNQLLGYIGLISEKEVKGMEPVIELLSKLISDQIMMENSTFRQKFESISEVEMEILELIFLGKTDDEIAKTIQFSKSTVRFYISKLFKKFKVKKRIELSNIYNELNSSRMKRVIVMRKKTTISRLLYILGFLVLIFSFSYPLGYVQHPFVFYIVPIGIALIFWGSKLKKSTKR